MLLHHFQFYWNCTQNEYCLLCWVATRFFSSALSNKSRCCAMKFFSTVSVGWNTITIIPTILKQYSAWSISPDTFFEVLKYRVLYKTRDITISIISEWNSKNSICAIKEQKTNLDNTYLKIYIYLIWLTNQYQQKD